MTTAAVETAVWTHRHLLGIAELSVAEIYRALDVARRLLPVAAGKSGGGGELAGRVLVNAFFEDSTRTRTSFSLAAKRLGAGVIDFSEKFSSTQKGESLRDTARTIDAMHVDFLVLRHPHSGAGQRLADLLHCAIINAGDGAHEHPTQALLDLFTIREAGRAFRGLRVAIVGDIANSRVARSNLLALKRLGAEVTLVGPATLTPRAFEALGAKVAHDLDTVLPEMDVIMPLRVQHERIAASAIASVREYRAFYGLSAERLARCKPDAFVLHPGPVNRGVELDPDVADSPRSLVLQQVAHGVAVRMAVLLLCHEANMTQRA